MLRHLSHFALAALALTVLAVPAMAVDTTFDLSPTSGTASLHLVWTDSANLDNLSSTWTSAVLSGTNLTTGTPVSIGLDFDATSDYYHGGKFEVPVALDQPGTYDFGQVDSGSDPNGNPWSLGSQDIFVTVTVASTGPGGGGL